jgi:hypothetical protein
VFAALLIHGLVVEQADTLQPGVLGTRLHFSRRATGVGQTAGWSEIGSALNVRHQVSEDMEAMG